MSPKQRLRRSATLALVLIVALLVGGASASAAPARSSPRQAGWGDLVSGLLAWLGAPGLSLGPGVMPLSDCGPAVDPNGCPRQISQPVVITVSDCGPMIDPDGCRR